MKKPTKELKKPPKNKHQKLNKNTKPPPPENPHIYIYILNEI